MKSGSSITTRHRRSTSTLPTFTKLVPRSHILFGTDYPFARAATVSQGLGGFGFSADDLRAIDRDNAVTLFPRLPRSG